MKIWRVKAHGIQVVNLFYLGGKEFKVLKQLRDRFVGSFSGGRKAPCVAKKTNRSITRCFISPIRDVLSLGRENSSSDYEVTRMWNTRNSLFWGWRRVAEYFRDLDGMNGQKEVHELMTH